MSLTKQVSGAHPIMIADVFAAERRIRPYLSATPLRRYALLDEAVGHGIAVHVKHENFQPTGSFKVRNGLSLVTALSPEERQRGLIAATKGNHGQALAYAGSLLSVRVRLIAPLDNVVDKNAAMAALGAEVIAGGRDYDEATVIAARFAVEHGWRLSHSTNDPAVLAGAACITLEIVREQPHIDAIIVAVGGGSQAVGAIVVAEALRPDLKVYAVQAEGAAACHDSWHARVPIATPNVATFADGIASRTTYELSFPTLLDGLSGFLTVSDAEIAEAIRLTHWSTHSTVEAAGAVALAGLLKLRLTLAGQQVAVVLSGANIDGATLARVLSGEI